MGMKEWVLRMLEVHDIHEPVFIKSIALYKESIQIEAYKRKGVQEVHPISRFHFASSQAPSLEQVQAGLRQIDRQIEQLSRVKTTLHLDFCLTSVLLSTWGPQQAGKRRIVEQCPSSDTDVPATQRGGFSCRDSITRTEMKPERKHSMAQPPLAGDCQYGPEKRSQLVHEFIHRSKLLSEQLLNTSVIITTEERGGQWGGESDPFRPSTSTTSTNQEISHFTSTNQEMDQELERAQLVRHLPQKHEVLNSIIGSHIYKVRCGSRTLFVIPEFGKQKQDPWSFLARENLPSSLLGELKNNS